MIIIHTYTHKLTCFVKLHVHVVCIACLLPIIGLHVVACELARSAVKLQLLLLSTPQHHYHHHSLDYYKDMMFDSFALAIGLYAAVISKWEPTRTFSYGFGRVQVLSGFVNAVFLMFIAFFILMESVERFMEPVCVCVCVNVCLCVSLCEYCMHMH